MDDRSATTINRATPGVSFLLLVGQGREDGRGRSVVVALDIWIIFPLSSCHSFFSFPYLHVERSRRRRIHPPSPSPLRLDVGRCLSHAHTHTYAEMSTTQPPRQGKYHAERARREKTKRATHTHITHHTLRIMYMPLYIPNIPMSIRPCSLYASVSPCHAIHPTQLNPPPPLPPHTQENT